MGGQRAALTFFFTLKKIVVNTLILLLAYMETLERGPSRAGRHPDVRRLCEEHIPLLPLTFSALIALPLTLLLTFPHTPYPVLLSWIPICCFCFLGVHGCFLFCFTFVLLYFSQSGFPQKSADYTSVL